MFRSNWRERFADIAQWGGGVLTFIVCLVVTWLAASQYGHYSGYQEAKTENATNTNAQKIDRACRGFSGPELVRCSFEVEQSTEDASRTEKDLQAQRDVALWSFWLMLLGVGGLAGTGVGLYYLAANLSEMQSQRRLMRAQLAPQLVLPDACSYVIGFNYIAFAMTVENKGLSSVSRVEIGGTITFSEDDFRDGAKLFRVGLWGMPAVDVKPHDPRKIDAIAHARDFPEGQFKRLHEDGIDFQILLFLNGVDELDDRIMDFEPQRLSSAFYAATTDQHSIHRGGGRVEKHGTMKRRN